MSYGIEIYDAYGTLTYSVNDVTWNQVDYFYAPGGGSVSNTYPILDGKEVLVFQLMIDPPPTDRRAVAHNLSVSGTTVTASGGSENAYVLVLMR